MYKILILAYLILELLPSMRATQLLVVPKSIPIIFAISIFLLIKQVKNMLSTLYKH